MVRVGSKYGASVHIRPKEDKKKEVRPTKVFRGVYSTGQYVHGDAVHPVLHFQLTLHVSLSIDVRLLGKMVSSGINRHKRR